MTLRAALVFAVDHLRSNADDDPMARSAARVLGRKAERLRARMETSWVNVRYCFCGEQRAANGLICAECNALVPATVMIRYHLGRIGESQAAMRTIKGICAKRANLLEEAA